MNAWILGIAVVALVAPGCSSDEGTPAAREADVKIGAYPFAESLVLAHVYELTLERAGFTAEVVSDVASREYMIPALEQGVVDVAPEYQGTLLRFLSPEQALAVDQDEVLANALADRDLVATEPAPAQNRNEFVVTSATASRYGLERISDLAEVAEDLTLGGPPECPTRPLCLQGLENAYGLEFESFQALDAGGPLTLAALHSGEIDVGLLFTTDPNLFDARLVVLEDDRRLQPADHIFAVASDAAIDEVGGEMLDLLGEATSELTVEDLRDLNELVAEETHSPRQAAERWVAGVAD